MFIKSGAKRTVRYATIAGAIFGALYTVVAFALAPDEAGAAGVPQEGYNSGASSLLAGVLALLGGGLGGCITGLAVACIVRVCRKLHSPEIITFLIGVAIAGFIGAGLGVLFAGFYGASLLANPTIAAIFCAIVTGGVSAITLLTGRRKDPEMRRTKLP